jgi:hypothetical protein
MSHAPTPNFTLPRQKMTATARLNLIRAAVSSANETITSAQAISLIAAVVEPTMWRINPDSVPTILALVTPAPRTPAQRRRRARGATL